MSTSLIGMFKLTSSEARPPPQAAEMLEILAGGRRGFCFSDDKFGACGMLVSENVTVLRLIGENILPAVDILRVIKRIISTDLVSFISPELLPSRSR